MFSKDPFQGGPGFIGSLTGRYMKKEIGEIRLQIVLSASSMRFKYLDFSMDDVSFVSIFKVNLYNPLVWRCMAIFSFHEK
jgi:hypothetical protein